MQDAQAVVSLVLSLWGIIALVLGPYLFFKARSFFPERREAISPEQLRTELAAFDKGLRDSFNPEFGRLRLSSDEHHREVLDALRAAQSRAEEANQRSLEAFHKAEIVEERLASLDRLVIEKLENLKSSIAMLKMSAGGK